MLETLELCTAGRMVVLPGGVSVTLPFLPWSPDQVRDLPEEDREEILKEIREQREAILKHL